MQKGCKIFIAAEGKTKKLLWDEFPGADFIPLKGYEIEYPRHGRHFGLKIASQVPKLLAAIRYENQWLREVAGKYRFDAVLSDNRFGLYHQSIPGVFLTHQLSIHTGLGSFTNLLLRKLNYHFISRFSQCWIPDFEGPQNLAGSLSHPHHLPANAQYIGGLSRFEVGNTGKKYDILVILSGPEPQRTLLEKRLVEQLQWLKMKSLLVRGLPGETVMPGWTKEVEAVNHLESTKLNEAILQSDLVVSRAGYTTVMDLVKLRCKSLLIPTPGQPEQEYLASYLLSKKFCCSVDEENLALPRDLETVSRFPFAFPSFNMDQYKEKVSSFLDNL